MFLAMIYLLLLLIVLPNSNSCNQLPSKPIVGLQLSEDGMHREIIYTVQFADTLIDKNCQYVLEQLLPAGVYISVDQLDELKRLKKLSATYPKFIDIESPTEKSSPLNVLLYGKSQSIEVFKLPIHYRYHLPSKKNNKFATVEIPIPKLYIKCEIQENNSIEDLVETASKHNYCQSEASISFIVRFNENESNSTPDSSLQVHENCDWYLIDVHIQLKTDLRADIPIGNEKAFPPILYATIILSWIISLYTVSRTHVIPRRINYKLEEQRILQNKIK
ncbi:uncharacterized protein LOC101458718 [Ceratitis capitata]|uniref:Phosphatidylinositol-glycan biosynthesis class X protein n=1 Tax=Ceratitis capitata TaxID=7213 RepID=A0A811VI08_CERCA|nr:uncharacterized protein LOC101458718 [Ceratitis capitata]CAD7014721.1 unnamed protein product [Ceratitis capitata]